MTDGSERVVYSGFRGFGKDGMRMFRAGRPPRSPGGLAWCFLSSRIRQFLNHWDTEPIRREKIG